MDLMRRVLFVPSLVAIVACSTEESATEGPAPGADRKTATVTPDAGGTLTSADGRLVITIPPGAVASTTDLWVESVPKEKAEADFPDAVPQGLAYLLGPDGQKFDLPASAVLTLALDEVQPSAKGIPAMALFSRSAGKGDEILAATGTIAPDGTTIEEPVVTMTHDAAAGVVRIGGDLRHFSQAWTKHAGDIWIKGEHTAKPTQQVGDEWYATLSTSNQGNTSVTVGYVRSEAASACASVQLVLHGTECSKCCEYFTGEQVNPAGDVILPGAGLSLDPPARYRCAAVGQSFFRYSIVLEVDASTSLPAFGVMYSESVDVACTDGKLENGAACTLGSACSSDNCVDDVCCDTTCTGTCQACDVQGSAGTCSKVPEGQSDPGTCETPNACDGNGTCKPWVGKLPNGAACTLGSACGSGNCADGVCCDTTCTGTCQACNVQGSAGACSFVASGQPDAGTCVTPNACNGKGVCLLPNGALCPYGASQCQSGICTDMYCCNSACPQLCMQCDVSGSEGTCTNVPSGGGDPDGCFSPDKCDGNGACLNVPATNGTPCANAADCQNGNCVDGVCCNETCNLPCYTCTAAKKGSGADGVCGPVQFGKDYDDDCPGYKTCQNFYCKSYLGMPCPNGNECTVEYCRDGVCCDNANCTMPSSGCTACTLANTGQPDGTCAIVKAGTDPFDWCKAPNPPLCAGPPNPYACQN